MMLPRERLPVSIRASVIGRRLLMEFPMWWGKKTRREVPRLSVTAQKAPLAPPEVEPVMSESTPKVMNPTAPGTPRTLLGRTVVAQGQLSANEDLLIEGQFQGNITLDDHCLTVGTEGHVKAEVRARQVVVLGSMTGNVVAREKIEIRRTGHIVGDLQAASVAIEEGAYFKGSIDITREGETEDSQSLTAPDSLKAAI
jgi:cytoskeletal protein CcmA (bactofilin family)